MAHNDRIDENAVIDAVLWKLYLSENDRNNRQNSILWESLEQNRHELLNKIVNSLTDTFRELLQHRLDESHQLFASNDSLLAVISEVEDTDLIKKCMLALTGRNSGGLGKTSIKQISDVVKVSLETDLSNLGTHPSSVSSNTNYHSKTSLPAVRQSVKNHSVTNQQVKNYASSPGATVTPDNLNSLPPKAQWQYQPVLDTSLDEHTESDSRQQKGTAGFNFVGARVRGKKHKHEGTNCDDWFEFTTSGRWNIIAVSDGAGSKKFSRVGAKESCIAAIASLSESLKNIQLTDAILLDSIARSEEGRFKNPDVEAVQTSLHEAIRSAYHTVEKAAQERQGIEHAKIVNPKTASLEDSRSLDISDLSATLLLVVQTIIRYQEKDYSFLLTCQVGDGMVAALSQMKGTLEGRDLGIADSGQYAGQTDFLTSKSKIETKNLIRKTQVHFMPMKALMVMTDGVADDYFPAKSGIQRLYGDLLLNRIVAFPHASEAEILTALQETNIPTLEGIKDARKQFQTKFTRIVSEDEELKEVTVTSFEKYAKELGKEELEVLSSNSLLTAGLSSPSALSGDNNGIIFSPEECLKIWLDSYTVKGSFDDRTLVILYFGE